MAMRQIACQYAKAASGLANLFPREDNKGLDYFPYRYIANRMRGYVPDWMEKVVEKNNGVPPKIYKES